MRSVPMLVCVFVAAFLSGKLMPNVSHAQDREPIGHVLGEPVYRDQLTAREGYPLAVELHRLFSEPLWIRYRAEHREEIEPTEEEIDRAMESWCRRTEESLELQYAKMHWSWGTEPPPIDRVAWAEAVEKLQRSILANERIRLRTAQTIRDWKLQKHLYETYGGGRMDVSVGIYQAYDATRVWLEQQETQEAFAITDPKLRQEFYSHWTTQDDEVLLTSDHTFIRAFLQCPWWLE